MKQPYIPVGNQINSNQFEKQRLNMQVVIDYHENFPLLGWDRDVFGAGLKSMFDCKYFNICRLDKLTNMIESSCTNSILNKIVYEDLQSLHCVHFEHMDSVIANEIPAMIGQVLGIQVTIKPSVTINVSHLAVRNFDALTYNSNATWHRIFIKTSVTKIFERVDGKTFFRAKSVECTHSRLLEVCGGLLTMPDDEMASMRADFELLDGLNLSKSTQDFVDILISKLEKYLSIELISCPPEIDEQLVDKKSHFRNLLRQVVSFVAIVITGIFILFIIILLIYTNHSSESKVDLMNDYGPNVYQISPIDEADSEVEISPPPALPEKSHISI